MTNRLQYHPLVLRDLLQITRWIEDYAGARAAQAKSDEIEQPIESLVETPHIGSLRTDIAPRLRAIPAAKKGVIAFTVDDDRREVRIICITFGGAAWARRSCARLA